MSELITPEEFIQSKEFIQALKDIDKGLQDVLKTIGTASAVVKKYHEEVKKGATNQKELTENQKKANETTKQTIAIEKEQERIERELARTKAKITLATSEQNKQLVEEKKKLKDVTDQVNGVTDAEKKRRANIGKYKEDIVKAYVAIKGAILIAKTAFKLFIDVVNSTGSTQDAFTATLEGWKQGFNAVKVAIATMDFKDFSKRVRDAIDEGRRYAEGLDEIDDKTRALEIAEAKLNNTILEQRKIQNSALSTLDQRIAAGEKIKKLEEDMQVIRTGIANQAYENEITNLAAIANKTKDVTDAMKNEVRLYVERDAEFMKRIERGQKIADSLDVINKKYDYAYASHRAKGEKEKAQLKENTEAWNDYLLLQRVTLPTDEKYNLLKQKTVDLERAKGSALENTLRIQSKLDSAISKDGNAGESKEDTQNRKGEELLQNILKRKNDERDAENQFNDYVLEQQKKRTDQRLAEEEQITDDIIAQKEREKKAFEKAEEDKRDAAEETKMLQIDAANAVFDLGAAFNSREIAELETKRDKEIKAAGDNAKKKERIEAEYQKKIATLKRKQAIIDKVQALFNIGMNTAIGVTKATAQLGAFGLPVVTWIKLLGALQAAAVLAAPIPKFFKGVKDFKGGPAVVGEKGMELVETPKGSFLTPDKATTMLLPEHSTVHTHEKTIEKLKEMNPLALDALLKEQKLTRKALGNQVHHSTIITPEGWRETTKKANSNITHIDKYFRC